MEVEMSQYAQSGMAAVRRAPKPKFPRSFDVFSPTGHVVMAFEDDADAEHARQALFHSGFGGDDVTRYTKDEVFAEFRRSEEQAFNPLQTGQEVAKAEEYLGLALQGAGFLVVLAPDEESTRRAVRVTKPLGLKFAEKYNRLTLQELV
jgi:hypothetical protein